MKTAEKLQPARRGAIVVGPTTGARSVGRKRAEPDTRTYEGRFAARLGELVSQRGLTPPEFADKCEVGKTTAYHWLAGRNVPPLDYWPAIAKVLRVTVQDLLPPR